MCGLFGFSKLTPTTSKLIPALAIAMEMRGTDSWGVTDGDAIYKYCSTISSSYRSFPDLLTPAWHTRGRSQGVVSKRNAHPFKYISTRTGKTVVGMHNGHISNHAELSKKYAGDRAAFEVDSEHIFAHLAEDMPLGELEGYGAVVWWEYPNGRPQERKRYISAFNNLAIHVAKLQSGEVVYASTHIAIDCAARFAEVEIAQYYDFKQFIKYRLSDEGELYVGAELDWYHRPPVVIVSGGRRNNSTCYDDSWEDDRNYSYTSSTGGGTELCFRTACTNHVSHKDHEVCASCVREQRLLVAKLFKDKAAATAVALTLVGVA